MSRTYNIHEVISFRKTSEAFGDLSNMAPGYGLNINGILLPTAEHLYQACRFPYHPKIQEDIISEPSPMRAKWISRANIAMSRGDWDSVRIKIMRWCLQIKISQNWDKFSALLLETENKPIVEFTRTDKMWGAIKQGDTYVGVNALGRLLMEVREEYVKKGRMPYCVEPPEVKDFFLFSISVDIVCNGAYYEEIEYSRLSDCELL